MDLLDRRRVLVTAMTVSVGGAALAKGMGNPDEPAQGAIAAGANPAAAADPGPRSEAIAKQFPRAFDPPPTDVGGLPQFWASFNNAQRRVQSGGWARQVTQDDFKISTTIASVNMRLTAGGIREMHWHLAGEWAYVTYGMARITAIDPEGRATVADVGEGGLWYFPAGYPHSLQGLGPDGCEFIICFDDGGASEFNTLLVTDFLIHTPPEVVAQNFGVPFAAFAGMSLHNLWIFQGELPGLLEADQKAVRSAAGEPPNPFSFQLAGSKPVKSTNGGTVHVADSSNFKASTTIAAALVTVRPGGLREMHWHPNADEWQYYVRGSAEMTVVSAGPRAATTNFHAGDIGYVVRNSGHYVRNVGSDDLVFLEVFRAPRYEDVGLSEWLGRTPPAMIAQTLKLSAADVARIPKNNPSVLPV